MTRYLRWLLLSIGLHSALFLPWKLDLKPVELPLQVGNKAVSMLLVDSAPSVAKAESKQTPESSKSHPEKKPQTQKIQSQPTTPESVESKPIEKAQQSPAEKNPPVRNNKKMEPLNKPSRAASQLAALEPEGVLTEAKLLSSSSPKYPRRAIIRNQQGRVKVKFYVGKEGQSENIELLESSGHKLLDKSVLRFVEQERFVPASRGGKAIASTQVFSFRFVLM
jgi:periplasmic protein TonB